MGGVPLPPECAGVLNLGWWWSRAVLGTFQDRITWRPKHPGGSTACCEPGGAELLCTEFQDLCPGRGKRDAGTKCYRVLFLPFIP